MSSLRPCWLLFILLTISLSLSACNSQADGVVADTSIEIPTNLAAYDDSDITLKTIVTNGKLAYIGVGGEIDGVINPDLIVQQGMVMRLVLVNGDGMPHDLYLPDFDLKTDFVSKIGDRTEIILQVNDKQSGTYFYYCTVPGHRQAGQEGRLVVLDRQSE